MSWEGVYKSLPDVSGGGINGLMRVNEDKELNFVGNSDILRIGNALNSLPLESKIDFPRIVVVGSQSSGKTSILNGLLAMDLLPTGADMVTRTPLHLQLSQLPQGAKSYCEFGHLPGTTFPLTMPQPENSEVLSIRNEIQKITMSLAGSSMDVASEAIHLKVYTPKVPDLSLYDLPGLTLVACTDKGQPRDIKDKIRRMVGEHIKEARSLILAVMPARADLQVDMALDLIKEYDPQLERTIGVLTKMDLVDASTSMAPYLHNTVSKDLRTQYGYYAVRNRNPTEMQSLNIIEGATKEKEFFSTHPVYQNKEFRTRVGTPALGRALANVLVSHLRKTLPEVIEELIEKETSLEKELGNLGTSVPEDDAQKFLYLHKLLMMYAEKFNHGIEKRSSSRNVGRNIKEIFIKYRQDLLKMKPFSEKAYPDDKLADMLANCEGLRMSSAASHVEVLESCMKDAVCHPLQECLTPSLKCLNMVEAELNAMVDSLVESPEIAQFPLLAIRIREVTRRELLGKAMEDAKFLVNALVDMESSYIWTVDEKFEKMLIEGTPTRELLEGYFATVVAALASSIPKVVVKTVILKCQESIRTKLMEHLGQPQKLLREDPDLENKKLALHRELNTIINLRKLLDEMLSGV